MMNLAKLDLAVGSNLSQGGWLLAKGWLELLLDWGDDEDTVDMTSIFAAARDVLP